jgi:hypothetical protein
MIADSTFPHKHHFCEFPRNVRDHCPPTFMMPGLTIYNEDSFLPPSPSPLTICIIQASPPPYINDWPGVSCAFPPVVSGKKKILDGEIYSARAQRAGVRAGQASWRDLLHLGRIGGSIPAASTLSKYMSNCT